MPEPTIREILPKDIIFDAGTQARVQTDIKTCQAYIESMQDGIEFPPLDVFCDGVTEKYVLADGFHRLQSHCSFRPNEPIKCRVYLGTVSDARIFAAGANATHGLRRTNEDKRKAVTILLKEPQCITWSDRRIAEHAHVHHASVSRIRQELESTVALRQSNTRTGKDGRTINVENIGRAALMEPPEPETNIRTTADGKEVNVRGFDFTAHRRCDQCAKWDAKTGFCQRDESPQPSWTPGCTDWLKRETAVEPYHPPEVAKLDTKPIAEPTRTNKPKTHYVHEEHVVCNLYPNNPQLSVIEIRHVLGNEYLNKLHEAIQTITNDE